MFWLGSGYAQNSVRVKFITPSSKRVILPDEPGPGFEKFNLNTMFSPGDAGNKILSMLNDKPLFKIHRGSKIPLMIFTGLSFPDLVENMINKVNANLVTTYDDHIAELFRDAPSRFTLKCTIGF